jgi:hypothetical protein
VNPRHVFPIRPHPEELVVAFATTSVSKDTDLGLARDRHYSTRKSGKPDLRGGR